MTEKFNEIFPLAIAVDHKPGVKLVYDSGSDLLFTVTDSQLADIVGKGENCDSSIRDMAEILRSKNVLAIAERKTMFDASDENIERLIDHNMNNILMRKYVLEVTQDCNFRCSYCSNTIETEWRRHQHRHMSEMTARKAVDYYFKVYTDFIDRVPEKYREAFVRHNRPTLGYYGGEPTMNFKVVMSATEYMKSLPWEEHGIAPEMLTFTSNTNLSFVTNDMIDFLVDNDFILFASLDGPASEHDKNRLDLHGRPTFERAYRNLMRMRERAPQWFREKVTVMAVEAPNYDERNVHDFLDKLECHVSYLPMSTYGCFVANPKERLEILDKYEDDIISDAVEAFEKDPEKEIAKYVGIARHNLRISDCSVSAGILPTCPVATDNMMVDVDGNFHICHKTDGSFVLGNVDGGLDREALHRFYSSLAAKTDCDECRGCWAARSCGQCAAIRLKGGDFVNPSHDECEYLRRSALIDYKVFSLIYASHPDLLDRIEDYTSNPALYQSVVDITKVKWENYLR